MSAADVTRAAFASGLSPLTWGRLVRSATGGAPYHGALYGPEICSTLLDLVAQYPSSPLLQSYLCLSLGLPPTTELSPHTPAPPALPTAPLVPLYVYLSSVLASVGRFPSPIPVQLAEPLCRLALLTHTTYNSPLLPPAASPLPLIPQFVILLSSLSHSSLSAPPTAAPELLLHTLSLLQAQHQIPLLTPSEKQAILHSIDASQTFQDVFTIAYKGLVRVRELIRIMDLGEGGMWGPMTGVGVGVEPVVVDREGEEPSLPLMSLVLASLVENRTTPFGASSHLSSRSQLLPPSPSSQLYPSLLQASISLIVLHPYPPSVKEGHPSESAYCQAVIWRSFILSRLPALLCPLPESTTVTATTTTNAGEPTTEAGPFEQALTALFTDWKSQLDQCNPPPPVPGVGAGSGAFGSDGVDEEARPPSFRIDLLRSLTSHSLLPPASAALICPSYTSADPPLSIEAAENMLTPQEYIEDRLSSASEDALAFLTRMEGDWAAHPLLASWFRDRLASASESGSLDQLAAACRLLCAHRLALDLLSLWIPVQELVDLASSFLDTFDLETVDDPQSALSLYGEIVLFCQYTSSKYHLPPPSPSPAWRTQLTPSLPRLNTDESALLSKWVKALFSPNEGIDDPMLRSTDPALLLRLTTTVFHQALVARSFDLLDSETLQNGIGYFLSSLLSWTLVGVINYLTAEVERQAPYSSLHWDVLQTLVMSESCPRVVLVVTGGAVLRLLGNGRLRALDPQGAGVGERATDGGPGGAGGPGEGLGGLREVVGRLLCLDQDRDPFTDRRHTHTLPSWSDNCQTAIREAFTSAHLNRATTLDVDAYLSVLRPPEFVHILWDACVSGASMGAMDGCRIVSSFLLSGLRSPASPPLLPYFLLVFVPTLLVDLDRQTPPQSTTLDTLVTIITSACHLSFQLERSFLKLADGALLSLELRSRLQPRVWLNALLDRLETAQGPASRLLAKRLHLVLND
ncbi:hypothetical protein DACRYDRAFT_111335 [Dacryopinax primogenitus]|uniref:Mediator of RNA polymerase II transcription subunit 5 n=1 Tax=Dacryopinax primogenitus (strain DJM 731) TaxID=1858805 RepID=M5FQL4_DACPD|nr:uncharacterized protein DACRYDRAFT_111335 [Dacryopinax primogenitus]EJT97818.1 hypothetical protein DACRYDRAFT_111335 [Dacryopinax primogenitus]